MTDDEKPRRKFTEALSNGTGTVITRLIVLAMPFLFGFAVYAGQGLVTLWGEKIMSAIERIEHRLDGIDGEIDRNREFDRIIELRVQRNGDDINYLKAKP